MAVRKDFLMGGVIITLQLFLYSQLSAQLCINRFTSTIYKGINYDTFTTVTTTPYKEIVAAGNTQADNGIITKFSSKGTVLYSYQYNPVYRFDRTFYKPLKFVKIISTKDGSTISSASLIQDKYIGLVEILNNIGALIKTDKYGNVLWSKKFESAHGSSNGGFEVSVEDVIETNSGNLVIYLATDYNKNYQGYGKIICLDKNGNLIWKKLLATNDYDGGLASLQTKRGLYEASNGSIIVGDIIYKTQKTDFNTITIGSQLHILSLHPSTGELQWESNYKYPLDNTGGQVDIADIFELSNHDIVVNFSSYLSSAGARITVSNKGVFKQCQLYTIGANSITTLVSSTKVSGDNRCYLFITGSGAAIAQLDKDGVILWENGYDYSSGKFPANCFTDINNGYGILMSNFKSWESRLLLTDDTGRIDCANFPINIGVTQVSLIQGDPLVTEQNVPDQNDFAITDFPMKLVPYTFKATIECIQQASCCTDIIDSADLRTADICEGANFILPDNSIVDQSGTYYVVYQTPGGCDSIKYYRVKVNKNPASLSLGSDVCFDGNDSIFLHATPGYDLYKWMDEQPTTQYAYKITAPGDYYVKVSNICGTKTDTISAFKECDFPVYMPGAFTPNGDGKNDQFRVPLQNKNVFISLKIFNRLGQLVFHTTDVTKGWNGTTDGNHLSTQTFIYYLETKGLSGNIVRQKGTFILIR